MTGRGDVGHEHPDLAVLSPSRRPGVLPLHPGRPAALLQKPGVIDDQHRVRIGQVSHHEVTHVITDSVDVELRPAQQPLHPVRAHLTGMFSNRPPVAPIQPSGQPAHIPRSPRPRLDTTEPRPDPHTKPIKLSQPLIDHTHNHPTLTSRNDTTQVPLQY
ncbi:hypothetical protein GCM10020218_003480 [Dactylosporangium vinaceum]